MCSLIEMPRTGPRTRRRDVGACSAGEGDGLALTELLGLTDRLTLEEGD